jgi:hypothetical protein
MTSEDSREHHSNHAIPVSSTSYRGLSREEHEFQSSNQKGGLPQLQWLRFLEAETGCAEIQSSRFLCGVARLCGNATGSANTAF